MYRVGEGAQPTIPEFLSEEGKDFLELCFDCDPHERQTASELMDHAFVKVKTYTTHEQYALLLIGIPLS